MVATAPAWPPGCHSLRLRLHTPSPPPAAGGTRTQRRPTHRDPPPTPAALSRAAAPGPALLARLRSSSSGSPPDTPIFPQSLKRPGHRQTLPQTFKRPGPHPESLTRRCSPPAARRPPSLTCPAPRPGHAAGRRCFPAASPPRPQLPEGGALSDFYVPGSAVPGAQWERDTNRSLDSRFQLVSRQQRPRACSEPERSARSPPSAVHLPRDRATHVKTLKTKIHCGN